MIKRRDIAVRRGFLTESSPRKVAALGLLLGIGVALGQAPWSLPLISLVALYFIFRIFLSLDTRPSAFWFGWLTGAGYFATVLFWIIEPFMVDAPHDGWMAPFALLFLAGGMALFWGGAFLIAARISRGRISRLLALIACLGLAELMRSYVLTGFPWGLIGYVWSDTPLIWLAAWIGPHGMGALTLVLGALPLFWRKPLLGSVVSVAMLGLFWSVGFYQASRKVTAPFPPLHLRLVQPNAPQDQKWDPRYTSVFFRRLLTLSHADDGPQPDLVIWPESSVNFWLGTEQTLQKVIADSVAPARAIIGVRRFEGRKSFNSLALLDQTGKATAIYDKRHLVPFGEYFPYASLLSSFGVHGLASDEGGGFSQGDKTGLINMGKAGNVRVLICYEAIFPQILSQSAPRADWILQITNDAWFGKIAGPQQHLAIARFRAVEQGLPLVRVANTGISAVINAKGQIVDEIPLGKAAKLDILLPGNLARPLYSRTGDWLVFAIFLLLLGTGILCRRKSRSQIL